MLDLIRSWLVGITSVAILTALADGLMPQGPVRKVGRLIGGLLLLIAIMQPLLKLDTTALSWALTEYKLDLSSYSTQLEEENSTLMKAIIEEQTGAYISDKAASLGIQCRVAVEAGEEDYPVPEAVTVFGALTPDQIAALTREIETDFAIPADRQSYESGDGA